MPSIISPIGTWRGLISAEEKTGTPNTINMRRKRRMGEVRAADNGVSTSGSGSGSLSLSMILALAKHFDPDSETDSDSDVALGNGDGNGHGFNTMGA